jgi:hypothetical protein
VHLLVAGLAQQLAWQAGRSRPADGSGAVDQGGGAGAARGLRVGPQLLWLLTVGLSGLCVWQAVEVLRHHRTLPAPGPERRRAAVQLAKTLGTALFYGFLAVSAARAALGHTTPARRGHPGGARRPRLARRAGAGRRRRPGGGRHRRLPRAQGPAVGLPRRDRPVHRLPSAARPGTPGEPGRFVLEGVAFVLVGTVVGWAAATFDPARATGLDAALRAVAAEPHGGWVLTVVAVGLAAFSVYCLARARHPVAEGGPPPPHPS